MFNKAEYWPPKMGEWFSLYTNGFGVMIWIGCPKCGKLVTVIDVNGVVECSACDFKEKVELEGWKDG